MSVKLSYAICNDVLFHIKERIPKSFTFYCPFCNEKVIARKGNVYTPHFAHGKDSNCSVSNETLLHYNAKQFILRNREIDINFPINLFNGIKDLVEPLEIKYIPVKLEKILDYYYLSNENGYVEKKIGNFIADIIFENDYQDEDSFSIVIEIFVSHEMEEEKKDYFKKNSIPYIEVRPLQSGEDIQFFVTDFYISDFLNEFESDIYENVMEKTYMYYRKELIEKAINEVVNYDQLLLHKKEAIKNLKNDIKSINLRDFITEEIYKDMLSIPVNNNNQVDRMEEIFHVNKRNGKYISINNKYFVNYKTNIIYDLILKFKDRGIRIDALIEKDLNKGRDIVVGFNFLLPSTKITGIVMKNILNEILTRIEKSYNQSF